MGITRTERVVRPVVVVTVATPATRTTKPTSLPRWRIRRRGLRRRRSSDVGETRTCEARWLHRNAQSMSRQPSMKSSVSFVTQAN